MIAQIGYTAVICRLSWPVHTWPFGHLAPIGIETEPTMMDTAGNCAIASPADHMQLVTRYAAQHRRPHECRFRSVIAFVSAWSNWWHVGQERLLLVESRGAVPR